MDVGHGSASEREAYVSWSAMAEPADPVAGALVRELGAAAALAWVRRCWVEPVSATHGLLARLDQPVAERVVAAAQRWRLRRDAIDAAPHLERARKVGAVVLTPADAGWPVAMDDLGVVGPHALWVRGNAEVVAHLGEAVAVVGSRATTAYGEHMAARIASELADAGRAVVSGGAYGIDARAHRAALAAGGTTVAFLAGGVDRLYPAGNADLLRETMAAGAVVSESPPGATPYRARFLTRNRLIAAAGATVVVEAAVRSGALSTAHHAADIGRHVAAVPGTVTNPSAGGCHELIRKGAVLARGAGDVLELLVPLSEAAREVGQRGRDPDVADSDEASRLLDAIRPGGVATAVAAREAGLSIAEAAQVLGALEMRGAVARGARGWSPASASPATAGKPRER